MTGELTINGYDAYTRWGLVLTDTSISALMTPPNMKDNIENDSRLVHGKQIKTLNKINSRDLTLELWLTASSRADFLSKYALFCEELATVNLNIQTSYIPDVVYKTIYVSCTQFTQFSGGMAKFSLKLTEPNPTDRTIS